MGRKEERLKMADAGKRRWLGAMTNSTTTSDRRGQPHRVSCPFWYIVSFVVTVVSSYPGHSGRSAISSTESI